MNKNRWLCVIMTVIFILNITACNNLEKDVSKVYSIKKEIGNLNEDSHMSFKMLPSPPKKKETSNIAIIEEVLICIDNSLDKPIEEKSLKGWEIFIQIENGDKSIDIFIIGDKIQINNAWYQVQETLKRDLTKIYDNMEE